MSVRLVRVVKLVVRGVKLVCHFRVSSEGCSSSSQVCLIDQCDALRL